MRHLLALLLLTASVAFAAKTVPLKIANTDFEAVDAKGDIRNWTNNAMPYKDNPHGGTMCVRQKSSGSNWDCIMYASLIPAKPKTTYRLTFWNRNTLTDGWAKAGIRLVDKNNDTMRCLGRVGYDWCSVKPGQNEWTKYTMEFITPPDLAYINIYFQVSKPVGDVFWDDVSVEEIQQ